MTYRPQRILGDETAQDEFLEDLELNMGFIEENVGHLDTQGNMSFALSLVEYFKKFEMLTPKQIPYATKFWQELNSKGLKR